jgi:light-regulated signal transduction histidine kinase (bacteriophytochrome)
MRDLRAAIRNQPPADHPYDWDPLHMPGSVQSYGVLLVVEPRTRRIIFASENAGQILGIPATELLDKSYLSLSDSESEKRVLRDQIGPDTILFPNPVRLTIRGRSFDAIFHAQGDEHQIELEPHLEGSGEYAQLADRAVIEMFEPNSVDDLYQRAVRVVREVTGFDRVMLYRFDARYNGQVLAEDKRDDIGSFLGLFFPSGDISARARELYLKNFTRYIPDIAAETHGLVGVYPGGGKVGSPHPVDMTNSNLRSVFPCHVQYLANIGVKASMSFSINVDDRLWGLFACHHYKPRLVSFDQRTVCEQTAMMFIYKLNALTSTAARFAQRAANVRRLNASVSAGTALARRITALQGSLGVDETTVEPIVQRAVAAIHAEIHYLVAPPGLPLTASAAGAGAALTESQKLFLDLVEADSAAVIRHGSVYRIGDAPADMAIFAIASMFGRELPDLRHGNLPVFATDSLAAVVPVAEEVKDKAAGILAASLSDDSPALIIWFRREQIVHGTWAGNPEGGGATGGDTGTHNPRASFAAWKKDIRNLSRSWMQEDVETAYELIQAVRGAESGGEETYPSPAPAAWQSPAAAPPPGAAANAAVPLAGARPRRVIRIGQV